MGRKDSELPPPRKPSDLAGALLLAMVLSVFLLTEANAADPGKPDGCYLCEGGGYVAYFGQDTFELRRKAQEAGCKVSGTTSSCSRPKAMVMDDQHGKNRN